jgi:hypothetical protein
MSEGEDELKRQIESLKARLETEKAKGRKGTRLAVSKKGGVSLYGLRRFPITFYLEEWNQIFDMEQEIRAFLAEHESELAQKG